MRINSCLNSCLWAGVLFFRFGYGMLNFLAQGAKMYGGRTSG